MKTWIYTCDLIDDPEILRQYDTYHAEIWPEVAESLQAVGMQNIKIWRLGTRLMMWIETADDFDPAEAGRIHRASHPRCEEWETLMQSFQRRPAEAPEGENTWVEMTQVFDLADHS
jgi:L-rhamnose mutarotase